MVLPMPAVLATSIVQGMAQVPRAAMARIALNLRPVMMVSTMLVAVVIPIVPVLVQGPRAVMEAFVRN
jgi:hypothetical protein